MIPVLFAGLQRLQDARNPIPWQVFFYAGDAASWLDLGSNDGRTHRGLDRSKITAVELFGLSLEKLRAEPYAEIIQGDVRVVAANFAAMSRTFERVTATDVIEHLPKADGYKLIADMERIATGHIMIMMPIETPELVATEAFQQHREWGLAQHPSMQRELQDHKSQWAPDDLTALGYTVVILTGLHGFFDAFAAVKCADAADTMRIRAQVQAYEASGINRQEWGYLGYPSNVVEPLYLAGQERIFIGDRVTVAYGSRIEAIDKHQGQHFGGQVVIGDGTSMEMFAHIGAASRVTIGRDVMIAGHVTIMDHDHTWRDRTRPPRYQGLTAAPVTISDGAWIGEGAFIGKGVNVGAGAIVGAHSVVTRDVPAGAVVAGAPARIIKRREPKEALTSIIIPTVNMERAALCRAAIDACTPEPHEVIVIDNSRENRGWIRGCNEGLAAAKGDYLCLLNDDVTVTPGWLDRLIGTLERYPEAGLAGPVTNYCAGPQMVPEGYEPESHWGETQEVDMLIGFCLLMRREVYDLIGGLDERFGVGNFDDNDYLLRARMAGFEARIVRDVWVHHEGHATFRELGIDYGANLAENRAAFCDKWGIEEREPVGVKSA